MYQKVCLSQNVDLKGNIFDMQFPPQNIVNEKINKYMFVLLLNDLCSIFLWFLLSIKLELNFYLYWILFTGDIVIPKRNIFW